MYRGLLFTLVVLASMADRADAGRARADDPYRSVRQELHAARVSSTLGAATTRLLRLPDVAATPALRQFVSGYAALLAYDRAKGERDLARSFALAQSPYAAAALATNAFEIGRPAPVLEWSTRGLETSSPTGSAIAIELRLLRAQALTWLTRYDEYRAEIATALADAKRLGDPSALALALRAHANVLDSAGEKVEALAALDEAIQLSESQGDRVAVGYHLLAMTSPYYPVHPFADKIALIDRGLRLARDVHDKHLEGRMLSSRGLALYGLARYGPALRDLIAADAVFQETGGLRSRASTVGNIGLVYRELGDYERATEQIWLSTALYRRIGNLHGVRECLDDLGRIAVLQGELSLAVARHRQVVEFTRRVGDTGYLPGALERLGLALLAQREWDAGERAIREAVDVAAKGRDRDRSASAKVAFADLLRLTGRVDEAERAYTTALTMITGSGYGSTLRVRADHGLATIASRRRDSDTALSHYRAALGEVERVRDAAGQAEMRLTYFADKTALYVDAVGALVDAYRDTGNSAHLHEAFLLGERAKARTLLDALSGSSRSAAPPAAVADIAAALGPSDLLLEYVTGAERSFVFTVSRDGAITVHQLPSRARLQEHVTRMRELVTRRPTSAADLELAERTGARAYAALLAPALSGARNVSRLIVVADGPLFYAPFEAFTQAGAFVGERFEVARAASGSILTAIRTRRDADAGSFGFVGFGDPPVGGAPNPDDAALVRALERDGFSFAPLPGAKREVEAAAGVFAPNARLYTGRDFTAAAALSELQRSNRVVHFATHAVLDDKVPSRSGILVSQPEADGATMLRARDFEGVRIRTDLVVLSACETGLGRIVDGEGVLGLSWTLTRAGAASLLVTLWNVSDAASASMMVAFYRSLAAGRAKSAALRAARLEMVRGSNPALRHPYYWAGYVLLGDPH